MSSTENNAEVAVEKQVDAVEAEEKTEKAEVKGAKRPAEVRIFSYTSLPIFSKKIAIKKG